MNEFIRLSATVIIGASALVMGLSGCRSGAEGPTEDDTTTSAPATSMAGVVSLPESQLKGLIAHYDPTLRSVSEEEASVTSAVTEVSAKLFSMLSRRVDLAEGECALYVLCNDKAAGKVWVESVDIYNPRAIGEEYPAALGLFVGLQSETDGYAKFLEGKLDEWSSDLRSAEDKVRKSEKKKEKIRIQVSCEDGEQGGESFRDDLPESFLGWGKFAKDHGKFLYDCLKGGGCLKVCRVSGTFAPSV